MFQENGVVNMNRKKMQNLRILFEDKKVNSQ